ncbi:acyltransferase family protein [Nonomuraea endophytica]|uniref:Peptidoglycan/LPS O-acetylase OafA/YrhL n=1 Tax=Nonomuraea endophytica TaxID=714136 RepID=A0A7W8A587_9ACTN|nr:SGNH hydrolase domain-containing protein [Nonomuraea endophytica]MBB5079753.1 peptidoglycan/LPS O-acetylase OafA/YrhL [Nonomuraea endophytica]
MTGHRKDIDGLRAVAVLFVLAFHASVPGLGGGFVGVDVFFVISGFLITGLIVRDLAAGTFSLADFYARRARRILPAAGVVLVASALAAWLLLPPLRATDVAADVFTAALYVANWRFIAQETDYLAADRDPSPLLHFWSLAVEEQFYLVWAPLLLAAFWLAGRRAVATAAVLVTAGSFALSLSWEGPAAYLASPTRAWQFGVGALSALALPYLSRTPRLLAALLGTAGAAALAWSLTLDESGYPGLQALVPTLGTAALILFRSPVSALLGHGWTGAVGRLSFAWYLWHWPVVVLFGDGQPWPVKLALVIGSALPAWLTMRLVEQPVRFSKVVAELPRRGLAVGTAAMTVPVTAALLLGGASVPRAEVAAAVVETAPTVDAAAARTDYPPSEGCEVALTATTSPPCLFTPSGSGRAGAVPGNDRVVLLGDSHAGQWFTMARRVAERRGWTLEVLTKPGCPLPALKVVDPRLGREYRECDEWRENTLTRLEGEGPPRLILLGSLSAYADKKTTLKGWRPTLERLSRLGAPLVYLRDTPLPGIDVPACLSGRPAASCAFPRSRGLAPDPLAAGKRPGLWTLDVSDLLCPGNGPTCPAALDGVVLYRDDSHLTNTLVQRLAPRLEQQLERLDLIPTVL